MDRGITPTFRDAVSATQTRRPLHPSATLPLHQDPPLLKGSTVHTASAILGLGG